MIGMIGSKEWLNSCLLVWLVGYGTASYAMKWFGGGPVGTHSILWYDMHGMIWMV